MSDETVPEQPVPESTPVETPAPAEAQVPAVEPEAETPEPEATADLDLDLDLPDIPEPDETEVSAEIEDEFDAAVKYAFLGVGHAGSRIAESFWALGYRRILAVNTAKQDLDEIKIPEENKLNLDKGGAAKNRNIGKEYIKDASEDIMDKLRVCFGDTFDRIIVICALGGGTGSGGFEPALDICNDLTESLNIRRPGDPTKVGLMVALPLDSERDRMSNAIEAMKIIDKKTQGKEISPVVVIDNSRISTIYKSATLGNVWGKANKSIAAIFHLFNTISKASTKYTAFDPADYKSVIQGGYMTYGQLRLDKTDKESLAKTIRNNLKNNVLSGGIDLSTAKSAACVILGESKIIDKIPAGNVEHAYAALGRVVNGASIHRGIYGAKRPLTAFTLVGGLDAPKERLAEIARMAGVQDWDNY